MSYYMEPFLPDLFDHSSISSAYPPDRSIALFPANIYFAWSSSSIDSEVAAALWLSTNTIRAAAIDEGQNISDVAVYGNYALRVDWNTCRVLVRGKFAAIEVYSE